MSTSEALSKISWIQLHPIASTILFTLITLIVMVSISSQLDKKFHLDYIMFIITGVVAAVICCGVMIATPLLSRPSKSQIEALRQTPISTTSTETVSLVSAQSASYSKLDVQKSSYYVDASSTDTTSYRYFVKTANGDYQVKTLSDTYGKINSGDVYIHQQNNKPSTLVVKHLQYSSKKVRDLLMIYSDWSPKWSTYTFNVPENSITKTSDFK